MSSPGGVILTGVRTSYPWPSRALDLALTLLLAPLVVPLALVVAIAVIVDSPGPVLYRSARVGRDGRRFEMLKFRTMRHGVAGPAVTSDADSRHTPIGRLLAMMRLDELPQAWNVLRGQMRLVGPRPEVERFVLDQADAYRAILGVPPGVTGPTQLAFADEGRRLALAADPERAYRQELLPQKVVLDIDYATGASIADDLKAIARTFLVPGRQLARAIGRSDGSFGRAPLAMARTALLTVATVAMVALFALEGSTAL